MGLLTIDELSGLGEVYLNPYAYAAQIHRGEKPSFRQWAAAQRKYGSAPAWWQFWRGESKGETASRLVRVREQAKISAREASSRARASRAQRRRLARYKQEDAAAARRAPRRKETLSPVEMRLRARARVAARRRAEASKRSLARQASAAMLASRDRLRVEAEHRRATAAARYSRPVTGSAMAMRTRPPVPRTLAHQLATALVNKRRTATQHRAPTVTRGLVAVSGGNLGPVASYTSG